MFGTWLGVVVFAVIVFLAVAVFKMSYKQIPPAHVAMFEKWGGREIKVLSAGNHFICPVPFISWMGKVIPISDQTIVLKIGKEDGAGTDGKVEFKDESAAVIAQMVFRVIDPKKAAYEVDEYKAASIARAEAFLRQALSKKDLEDAINEKNEISETLKKVLKARKALRDAALAGIAPPPGPSPDLTCPAEVAIYRVTDSLVGDLEAWGVDLKDFSILDFDLDPKTQDARRQKFTAKKEAEGVAERAKGEKQRRITLAEGDRQAMIEVAEGETDRINRIANGVGISKDQSVGYVLTKEMFGALKDATVVFSGGKKGLPVDVMATMTAMTPGMNRKKAGGDEESPKPDSNKKGGGKK